MVNKWLEDIRQAAENTARREQRGDQLSFRDIQPQSAPSANHEEKAGNQGTSATQAAQRPTEAPEGPQDARSATGGISPICGEDAAREAPEAPEAAQGNRRQRPPFTGRDPARNYRAFYRAACDFHERHNPPTVDCEYWQSHAHGTDDPPQAEREYWERAAQDIGATAGGFNNDPFLTGLLLAIYDELEREYTAMKEAAATAAAR